VVYIDDILIFSKSREEHCEHACIVLKALRSERLYVKLRKGKFAQRELRFLGHVMSPDGLAIDTDKVAVVSA
jgi:hypothetical protein